ncbi:MAG: SDR family oxidoreductase [Thermotogae bacterium]|nr:SDR family oxidoreductase [Thermotogota bacterium]
MKVLILGANSAIAKAVAQKLAEKGHELFLASRNLEDLERFAKHLTIKYDAKVSWAKFDATDYDSHSSFLRSVLKRMGEIDWVLLAFGYLGDQDRAVVDFEELKRIVETNYLGALSILTQIVPYMEERGRGVIGAITSVAGDRGRGSNFPYGSAKGGLSIYLSGLRNRLFRKGVKVVDIKPGFVDTPMTEGLDLPRRLVSSPERVAKDIVKAMERGKDVVYIPWYWALIMTIIRLIPEPIFKRLRI